MSNNVVMFPKSKIDNPASVVKLEEIQRNMEMMRHYHIQETILNLTPMIFNQLDVAGFCLSDDDEDIKDGAFIVESLRSYMLKYYGEFHPFQILAENVFEPKEGDEATYKIVDEIAVELTNPEDKGEE